MWQYKAQVLRIVDGDTIDVMADLGFRSYRKLRLRLLGIDTPEVYGVKHDSPEYEAGLKASSELGTLIAPGDEVVIETSKGTGKYGRWLAVVTRAFPGGETMNINEAMAELGYGDGSEGEGS